MFVPFDLGFCFKNRTYVANRFNIQNVCEGSLDPYCYTEFFNIDYIESYLTKFLNRTTKGK